MSLLARLVVLVLLAVLPAIAIQFWSESRARADLEADIRNDAFEYSVRVAREVETAIGSARRVLATLAETRGIRRQDPAACEDLLRRVVARQPAYLLVSATDPEGRVFCSNAALPGDDVSGRRYVQETTRRQGFYVDGYVEGRNSGAKLLVVALPIRDETGGFAGVLAGGIDLGWLEHEIRAQRLPADTALAVVDRDGTILVRLPDPEKYVGTKMPDRLRELVTTMVKRSATDAVGLEGIVRVGAMRSVDVDGEQALTVGVGLNKAVAFAPLDAAARRDWALTATGVALAILAALLGGRFFVRRPVGRLLDASQRWRRGDYGARVALSDRRSELGRLGAAFDEMAAELEAREAALQRSKEEALAAARAQLAESEARYEALFNNAPESLFVFRVTEDGRFIHEQANPANQRLLAKSLEEMRGRELKEIVPADVVAPTLEHYRECVATRAPVRYELTHGSGARMMVRDIVLVPLLDETGRVVRLLGSSRDVSQRRRAEEALRVSEASYRTLYQRTPVMLHSIDRNGILLAVSDFWCETMGYAREEVVGHRIQDFYTEDSRQESLELQLPKLVHDGEIRDFTLRLVKKDGTVMDALLAATSLRDGDGNFLRSFSVVTDVTELLRVQEQLRQAQKMEAIGQMTGGVAHDFNNLLTVLIGNLELIRHGARDQRRVEQLAAAALGAAERGEKLTQQLLAFARRQMLRPETVDPNRLIEEFLPLLRGAAGETVEIELRLAVGLACRIDRAQFESAILNLVVNGRDAMPGGGRIVIETGTIELAPGRPDRADELAPGSYILVAVSDTGEGMTPEIAERAFEPFFTTKDIGKGSGLGLSQVYGFARQSGGHLLLQSAPGAGTTVRLYLPRAAAVAAGAGRGAAAPPAATGSETVLVVDDNDEVAGLAEETLRGLGYRTLLARDGPAALELLDGGAPVDLLFTDIVMPKGMSGRDLAAEARRRRPQLAILLTSGYAVPPGDPAEDALPFLRKPYRRAELAAKVRAALDGEARSGDGAERRAPITG